MSDSSRPIMPAKFADTIKDRSCETCMQSLQASFSLFMQAKLAHACRQALLDNGFVIPAIKDQ
jgi:hypothetical protein